MQLLHELEETGYLTATNVRQIAHYAQRWNISTYEALLQTHILTEHSLADAIAETYKLERIYSFDLLDIDAGVLGKVPYADALAFQCLVPQRDEKGTYLVYLLNPQDKALNKFLHEHLVTFRTMILDKRLMQHCIEEAYPLDMQLPSLAHTLKE
jgi:hypothetical protein